MKFLNAHSFGLQKVYGLAVAALLLMLLLEEQTSNQCIKAGWPLGNCDEYGPPAWPSFLEIFIFPLRTIMWLLFGYGTYLLLQKLMKKTKR